MEVEVFKHEKAGKAPTYSVEVSENNSVIADFPARYPDSREALSRMMACMAKMYQVFIEEED